MFPSFFSLGPVTIYLYGATFALAIFAGFLLAQKRAPAYKLKKEEVESLFFFVVPFGLFFARLYHVFDFLSYYQQHPWEILVVWQGGLGIFGGILGGVLGVWFWSWAKKRAFFAICDFLVPSLALGQAIGRWGNFFNQEAFGPPTNLPWKIFISPQNRPEFWSQFQYFHPLFLYESVLNFLNLLILILATKRLRSCAGGSITALYFLIYGITRFFIEFFRFDTAQIDGIKVAHVLSLGFVFAGLYFLKKKWYNSIRINPKSQFLNPKQIPN